MTFHISHTDLDGYGAQCVTKKLGLEVRYFNSNYGKELDQTIDTVLGLVEKGDTILITDLNLLDNMGEKLNAAISEKEIKVQVLDHHVTGELVAAKYDWYHLDTTKCGTKLTFEYFQKDLAEKYDGLDYGIFARFIETVNVYDMWQEDNPIIKKGKTLDSLLSRIKRIFPEVLEDIGREFILDMLITTGECLGHDGNVVAAEQYLYNKERTWFEEKMKDSIDIQALKEDCLHIVRVNFMFYYIMQKKLYKTIEYNGLVGEVHYGLSSIFQEFSSIRNNSGEVDFVININPKGFLSLRSKGTKADVGTMSKKHLNGGGHFNAAGGSLLAEESKERYNFDQLFEILKDKLSKEG